MAAYIQNPFCQYYPVASKEEITIFNRAIADFKSPLEKESLVSLSPHDGPNFSRELTKLSKTYGCETQLKRVPTGRVQCPDGTFEYVGHVDILKTWNQLSANHIQQNAKF